MSAASDSAAGLLYGPDIIGKHRFRVRELYVARHVAPLVQKRRVDAVKLDLALRGIALLPEHAGKREPGFVLRHPDLTYEALFDMVRNPRSFSTGPIDSDDGPEVIEKKRKWVGEQLRVLESLKLVRRTDLGDGLRPELVVLRDLGDGAAFDDPGVVASTPGNSYVTILGSMIAGGQLRSWGAPEVVAYICAMVAERYQANTERKRAGEAADLGNGRWFRQPEWFNNENGYRLPGQVPLPFSTKTIKRGLQLLASDGLLTAKKTNKQPGGGRMARARNVYVNNFADPNGNADVVDLLAFIEKSLREAG